MGLTGKTPLKENNVVTWNLPILSTESVKLLKEIVRGLLF